MKNKNIFVDKNIKGIVSPHTLHQMLGVTNVGDYRQVFIGEVVDIILNNTHPNFNDNFENIGKIKFRLIEEDVDRDMYNLSWAYPLYPAIKQLPVIHESVLILNFFNRYFYVTVNFVNNINNNALPNVSESGKKDKNANNKNYTQSSDIPNRSPSEKDLVYGEYFKDMSDIIKPLEPSEGDLLIQGRFGNFMRFGSNPETGEPTFKLGIGQHKDVKNTNKNTTFIEDINEDKNSFWITSDELVPLKPITIETDHHLTSAIDPPSEYKGNQIIFNTDRFVINAKKEEIQLFSNKGISLCTNGYISVDTVKNIEFFTKDNFKVESKNKFEFKNGSGTFIDSPKIHLGKNAKEPIVLGDKLVSILTDLIDAILKETHPTGTGPSGPPINSADYIKIKTKLKTILSPQNKTL